MKIPDIFVNLIEVSGDNLLLEKYGLRIPVLRRDDRHAELNWPFNEMDIRELLK